MAGLDCDHAAQKMMEVGMLSRVPPCLSFLSEYGFGRQNLTINELRSIWWTKLKEGFYVEETGLFTDPWLKSELLSYVNRLTPDELSLGGLTDLVE